MPYDGSQAYQTPSLFFATYRVARELGAIQQGTATSGSATTLVDTRLLTQADDFWNGGTVWIIDATSGAAAPEEQFAIVSDFVNSTSTVTVIPGIVTTGNAFTATVDADDQYAISTSQYPLNELIWAVNAALHDIGQLETSDITTVDTATSQTEYSIPLAANKDLRAVYLQGRLNDANDNRWIPIQNYDIRRTATGTADLLILPFQYVTGRDIRLDYVQEHPELEGVGDHIADEVNLNHLVVAAAIRMLEWRDAQPGNDPNIERQLNRLTRDRGADGLTRLERVIASHKAVVTPRQSKLLILGRRVPVDKFTVPGP